MRRFILPSILLASFAAGAQTVEQDNLDISLTRVNVCSLRIYDGWTGHHMGALGAPILLESGLYGGGSGHDPDTYVGLFVVECNKGVAWTVDIDQGLHYGMGPQSSKRALSDGQGNYISYDLWTDEARTTEWMVGRGSVSGIANELIQSELLYNDREAYGSEWSGPSDFWNTHLAPGGHYHDRNVVTLTYN